MEIGLVDPYEFQKVNDSLSRLFSPVIRPNRGKLSSATNSHYLSQLSLAASAHKLSPSISAWYELNMSVLTNNWGIPQSYSRTSQWLLLISKALLLKDRAPPCMQSAGQFFLDCFVDLEFEHSVDPSVFLSLLSCHIYRAKKWYDQRTR